MLKFKIILKVFIILKIVLKRFAGETADIKSQYAGGRGRSINFAQLLNLETGNISKIASYKENEKCIQIYL